DRGAEEDDRVERPPRDPVVEDQEDRAEEGRRRGRDEEHLVVELSVAGNEDADEAHHRRGPGQERGGTGHHRPRGGRLDAAFRRVPPAEPLAEGRIHAPPLAMCARVPGGCGHLMSALPFAPEWAACGSKSSSYCVQDRAGSTS